MAVKELVVQEGGKSTITTEYLSFTDEDTEPASLEYLVIQPPEFGYLQLANEPGLLYPPQNEVLGGYTVFSLSVIPSFRDSVIPSFRQHLDIFAE